MLYREITAGAFSAWRGEPIPKVLTVPVFENGVQTGAKEVQDNISLPLNIEALWPDEALAAYGLYRPAEAVPLPEGKVSEGQHVERVEGVVRFVDELEDMDLAAYARQVSWQTRTAGTVINGLPIALDDGAIALINGLYVSASRDANKVFSFDTPAGSIELTSEQAIALSVAVSDWVQLTFDRRAAVLNAISAGQITTTAEIDAAFVDVTDGWTAA
jgi:hypothetical protein